MTLWARNPSPASPFHGAALYNLRRQPGPPGVSLPATADIFGALPRRGDRPRPSLLVRCAHVPPALLPHPRWVGEPAQGGRAFGCFARRDLFCFAWSSPSRPAILSEITAAPDVGWGSFRSFRRRVRRTFDAVLTMKADGRAREQAYVKRPARPVVSADAGRFFNASDRPNY